MPKSAREERAEKLGPQVGDYPPITDAFIEECKKYPDVFKLDAKGQPPKNGGSNLRLCIAEWRAKVRATGDPAPQVVVEKFASEYRTSLPPTPATRGSK